MNAGAYGADEDVVTSVSAVDIRGDRLILESHMLEFGYRTAVYRGESNCTWSHFRLNEGDPEIIKETMTDLTKRRGPILSSGSVFKRPEVTLQVN